MIVIKDEPVDNEGNISISLENTMRLLEENANSKVNKYFFAVYDFFEETNNENSALRAENKVLKDTIETLNDVIKSLIHRYEDKGE